MQEWINTIDEFLVAIDRNGTILRVNQSWIDFCVSHEISALLWQTGANYLDGLEKAGNAKELSSIKQVLRNEVNEHELVHPFLLGENETQWLQVKVRGISSASEDSNGAIIYHKPITPYSNSLQPITAEIVLESMTEGFCLLDDSMKVIYLNDIAEELLQRKRESMMGRGFFDVFPEAVNTNFQRHYEHVLKKQEIVEFVDYYKPLDTWFQIKACPLKKGRLAIYFQDVSERKKTEAQLMESTFYDYLTGLPNRRLMIQKISSLMEQGNKFSIFHLHIDNLNFINAVHQHHAGDTIMKRTAEKLKVFTNETCYAGRLDGNEFIILRKYRKGENLAEFAHQIEQVFCKPINLANSEEVTVSFSLGIACHPFDAQTTDELLSYAEIAMSEAKNVGGSSCVFFRPKMKALRNRNSVIEEGLGGDLKANGFHYTMQPQIDGNSGNLTGVEVLSRWTHPKLGELSPLEFIQLAEETGNIVPLTSHLLTEVFAQIKEWEKQFGWNLRTAINMTPSLLGNPDFFDSFFKLMDRYKIKPSLIEIEITEQAELTYSPKTLENLLLCKSKGISIAIDDFGTGFSMISYLTHFPITKIKIDKSFVQKIGQDRKSEAVLKSLIHLATSIECELVAEGVERREEAEFLQANNCSIFQGYLYDKPLKVSEFEAKYLQSPLFFG
ncbi:EAL domain-containing protein [Planococcus salinus]|uniref:EAL domain-containing protein n=1 Tax=Planococcus salinus TaxID=1848460 RepID=A0A3M8P5Z0_9BACL|nr:EAL domain-containing protein [Planococcus salinus]